jgi:hypothetical protein
MLWTIHIAACLAAFSSAYSYSLSNGLDSSLVKVPAPTNCKRLPIDSDWPSVEILNTELQGWEPRLPKQKLKHPNYVYEVKTVASVQRAVRFAAKYNMRLSILNSGHDFLGR